MIAQILYEKATLTERAVAFLLDVLFLNLLNGLLAAAGVSVSPLLLFVAYFTCFEGIAGRGLGKWATGIEVVNRKGEPPGLTRALMRTLLLPLSILGLSPHHDRLTGTLVVRS